MSENQRKINIVTLGCSKNVVDSEVLMNQLKLGNWNVAHNSNDTSAQVVIINTCGFIGDAKEESIDTIMNFVDAKGKGIIEQVFVMGCLSQRYKEELRAEIPEVDGFFGVSDLSEILKRLDTPYFTDCTNQRLLTTPKHYAYLKISEGCNWGCSYCAIPLIRGRHVSRTIESLVDEATLLSKQGVKELLLIAQDSTYYGMDIYGKRMISALIEQLSKINGIEWIRLHYAYPTNFPDDLIATIRNNHKVCKYIDIPFQHISDNVLKNMRRRITKSETITLINKLRKEIPNITIRTTLLVGHPGETEQDFNELVDFVKEYKFERVGVFTYSDEEGTYASENFEDSISQDEKERRQTVLMETQREISLLNNLHKIGQVLKVIVDDITDDYIVGRTEYDSPEVDQEIFISIPDKNDIRIGDFLNVRVISAQEYDLFGEIIP